MEKDEKKPAEVKKPVARKAPVKASPAKAPAKPKPVRYRALSGITYNGKHAQTGDILDDIPEQSVAWLLAQNYIEKVED